MNLKKRGLGRGLEALLAEEPVKEEKQPAQTLSVSDYLPINIDQAKAMPSELVEHADDRAAVVVALFKNIQRENLILQAEAEALRGLIAEFEAIIRADLS